MNKTQMILATILLNTSLFAATYYVSASRPDDSGNGKSWATAKMTIQTAVKTQARVHSSDQRILFEEK